MKPEPDYSKDELLSAVEDLLEQKPESDGGLTFQELYEQSGVSRDRLRRMLRHLHSENRLEVVRALRLAIDGIYRYCPAYRLKSLPPDTV